jgi:hypothetical protein
VPAVRFPLPHADNSHYDRHSYPSKNHMLGVPIPAAVFPWNSNGLLLWVFDFAYLNLLVLCSVSQKTYPGHHDEQSSKQFLSRVLQIEEPSSRVIQSTHSYTHFSAQRSSCGLKKILSSIAPSFAPLRRRDNPISRIRKNPSI